MQKHIQALRGGSQQGFTLIELLVVIVIIGVLIGLSVPVVTSYLERGRDTERKADVDLISDALEHYYADNNAYPETVYGNTTLQDNYNNGDTFPEDPQGGQYTYEALPSGCLGDECQGFTVTADLERDEDEDADASGNYVVESQQSSA